MKLIAFVLLTTSCFGADIVSNASGNWGTTGTWVGGVVPTIGDTVNIANGHTVTVSDNRTWGTSPADTTTVTLMLNATGKLVVTSGGQIHNRGNTRYTTGDANNTVAVECQQGSVCELWDSSAASDPKPQYTFSGDGTGGAYNNRIIWVHGVAGNPAILRANPSGARGQITLNGVNYGTRVRGSFASFANISKFDLYFGGFGNPGGEWDVTDSTFDNCECHSNVGASPTATQIFRHSRNVHTNTTGGCVLNMQSNGVPSGGGIREIKDNVFDALLTNFGSDRFGGFTISGNYFGGGATQTVEVPTSYQENFIAYTAGVMTVTATNVTNNYVFNNRASDNPHTFIAGNPAAGQTFNRIIWDQFGDIASVGGDSGEFMIPGTIGTVQTYSLTNSLFLPNGGMRNTILAATCLGDITNARYSLNHNTWYGPINNVSATPFLAMSENATCTVDQVQSVRSNLLWGDGNGKFMKIHDYLNSTSGICTACDYNGSYQGTLGATKGYDVPAVNANPGVHDVDNADPGFYDYKRNLALFDSKFYRPYKGLAQPAAWSGAATYTVGDFVTNTVAGVNFGLPVNFRYKNNTACAGGNPEPGALPPVPSASASSQPTWGNCWEFASLYDLRAEIAAKGTFNAPEIGAYGDNVIKTLLFWVFQGYSPTNSLYENAGHDGADIGAMSVLYAPPGDPPAPTTGVVLKGTTFKGGTAK